MKLDNRLITICGSVAFACLVQPAAARTCEAPPAPTSVDPPGFYQNAGGYAEAIKPLHAFIAEVDKAADEHDLDCVMDLLAGWAKGNALLTTGANRAPAGRIPLKCAYSPSVSTVAGASNMSRARRVTAA